MTTSQFHTDDGMSGIYHALRSFRRRCIIQLLSEGDEPVSTRVMAREIAAIEENIQPEQVTGEKYRNVYNSLSQSHLPSLAAVDIILYRSDRQMIESGVNFEIAALFLAVNRAAFQSLRRDSLPSGPLTSISD